MANQRPLLIIFLIVFVNLLGFGIIIPLLPFYAVHVGASPVAIGFLFASYSLSQMVATPALGNLSDRHGRRPILLFSLLGTVISFALLAVANTVWLLFVARIIDGLSGGNISTARAYISDITEEKDRARAFGMIGAAFGLGFIFGPALGGLLGHFGYQWPAWAAAGLAAVALALTWFGLPESHRRRPSARQSPWGDVLRLLARPALGRLLLIDFFYWLAFAVYETTFALFAKVRFDFGITQVGYLLAGMGVIGAVVQGGLVGPIVHRFGEKRTLVGGLLVGAAGLAAAALAHNLLLFVLALVPAAVGSSLSSPALIALVSHTGKSEEQGRIQGVTSALESLGRVFGPIWGNSALQFFGETAAYLSAAVILFGVALTATGLRDRFALEEVAPETATHR